MKRTKKIFTMCFTLALCVMSLSTTVFADTLPYNFTFNSTSSTLPVASGYKDDSVKKYYITINGGNISGTNKFGTRVRKSANDAVMSNYVVHTGLKQGWSYGYTASINTSTKYYLRAKKDDSSTTSTALTVKGKVTY